MKIKNTYLQIYLQYEEMLRRSLAIAAEAPHYERNIDNTNLPRIILYQSDLVLEWGQPDTDYEVTFIRVKSLRIPYELIELSESDFENWKETNAENALKNEEQRNKCIKDFVEKEERQTLELLAAKYGKIIT